MVCLGCISFIGLTLVIDTSGCSANTRNSDPARGRERSSQDRPAGSAIVQRLKDARTEAEREIEEYKQAKDAEFKASEAAHAGNTSTVQAAIDRETEVKLQAIAESYNEHKDAVVKKLLDRVVLVTPTLHRNLQKVES
ncbi:hypothetical protein AX15_002172 [Amanita polypyramis BW_CC]|nr:hypothetical protein AX15_002172 [Amanita polypyramis BW_CC]